MMRLPGVTALTFFLATAALWGVGVVCFVQARPLLDFQDDFSPRDFTEFQGSVVGSLCGQFRMSVGDLLWLKSDEYLHGGVRHRRKTQKERDASLRHDLEESRGDHDHDRGEPSGDYLSYFHDDDHDMVTVIPAEERDVRGLFGELDREVHPFSLHAPHSDPEELAPWYRLLTYVNPNHVRGYVVGAYIIGVHGGQKEKALDFLLEGERSNPLSIEIKEAIGRYLFFEFDDSGKAIECFEAAISLGRQKTQLDSYEEFALLNAYRNRVLAYWRGRDDPATARTMLAEGLERFPDDRAMKRLGGQLLRGESPPATAG